MAQYRSGTLVAGDSMTAPDAPRAVTGEVRAAQGADLATSASVEATPRAKVDGGAANDQSEAPGSAAAALSGACAVVAVLATPALLLNQQCRCLAFNAGAADLLNKGPFFINQERALRSPIPAVNVRLADAFAAALAPGGEAQILCVSDYGPSGEIVVSVAPLDRGASCGFSGRAQNASTPALLVRLSTDGERGADVIPTLRELYDLTELEAEAAFGIYCGQRVADFAQRHDLNPYYATLVRARAVTRLGALRHADVVRRVATLTQMSRSATASNGINAPR